MLGPVNKLWGLDLKCKKVQVFDFGSRMIQFFFKYFLQD